MRKLIANSKLNIMKRYNNAKNKTIIALHQTYKWHEGFLIN